MKCCANNICLFHPNRACRMSLGNFVRWGPGYADILLSCSLVPLGWGTPGRTKSSWIFSSTTSSVRSSSSSNANGLSSLTRSTAISPLRLADINVGPTRFPQMQQAELSDMCREKDLEPTAEYWERRGQVSKGHLLFRTKNNKLLGNGPKRAQMGNEVWVLRGERYCFY
jgi:hypothetical protein